MPRPTKPRTTKPRSRSNTTCRATSRTAHIKQLRLRIDEYCEEHFGARCQLCGLQQEDSTRAAFHYHHVNPATKLYNIGEIWAKFKDAQPDAAWKSVQRELAKTMFLCAVCHAKVHYLMRKKKTVSYIPVINGLNDHFINQTQKEN